MAAYIRYPHAFRATLVSGVCNILSSLSGALAILLTIFIVIERIIPDKLNPLHIKLSAKWIIIDILLIAGIVVFYLLSKIGSKKLAEATIRKKIEGSVEFARKYCSENPYFYEYASKLNKEFGEKYILDISYALVERAKLKI